MNEIVKRFDKLSALLKECDKEKKEHESKANEVSLRMNEIYDEMSDLIEECKSKT